jgi:hypothetical protein
VGGYASCRTKQPGCTFSLALGRSLGIVM